jgi:hypothetical protein
MVIIPIFLESTENYYSTVLMSFNNLKKGVMKMKLNVKSFALTCAILWGLGVLLGTWWIILLDGSTHDPTFLGKIYRGFNLSFIGSIIGLVWGFFDGLIGGAIFAWLYNLLSKNQNSEEIKSEIS